MGEIGKGLEKEAIGTQDTDEMDDSVPTGQVRLARKLQTRGVLLYDALQGTERRAAELLMATGHLETYEGDSGFIFLRPLRTSLLGVLRGNIGPNSVVNRWARGDTRSFDEG